jgi:rhomboid protease GluP
VRAIVPCIDSSRFRDELERVSDPALIDSRVVLREAFAPGPIEDWALVLSAVGIPHEVEPVEQGWRLLVDGTQAAAASEALAAYDLERAQAARPRGEPPDYGRTLVGAIASLLLLGFFVVAGQHERWYAQGAALADRILHGESWRVVTALTLHADLAHVLGNAAALWLLLSAVARWVGPAAGAWLVLLSGVTGNFMTAWASGGHHASIGASTATFGALGALAGLRLAGGKRTGGRGGIVLFAAVALLGLLGAGERADVMAHLFGFLCGALLGAVAGRTVKKAPARTVWQPLGALAALGAVATAWMFALR